MAAVSKAFALSSALRRIPVNSLLSVKANLRCIVSSVNSIIKHTGQALVPYQNCNVKDIWRE